MTLSPGTRLGTYEILALIGAGGMGEVYRARDTRLNRDVALKVLPELFAADPERLARFKREAQVLASLNHPNIAGIHGFEDGRGTHALVLELVEGPTLADRIAQGPVPLDEALPIARQIADALEAAHEHGVIHRDLKPANIKVRPDGTVKVLDFGLAKAFDAEPVAVGTGLSMSPTITSPAATRVGTILGTAAYMSPEQARGKAVDKRSDIWAFGCVLYEMLTGRRPFEGEEVTDVLARVLERNPDLEAIPATVPSPIRRLLRRCLEKDRKRRLTDIGVARIEIDDAMAAPAGGETSTALPVRSPKRERLLWVAAIIATAAAATTGSLYVHPGPADAPEMRLQVVTPPGGMTSFAISPDGRSVVYQATVDGRTQLWLRALEETIAQPLAGTEDGAGPFWSPDSQWIGFTQGLQVRRISIAGGTPLTVVDGQRAPFGATWGADDVILLAPANTAPLFRVPASGGTPAEATRLDTPRQVAHRFPHFLPDGRRFLFFVTGDPGVQGIYTGSLDSMDAQRLVESDTAAVFSPPDYVLFGRQETLLAQRLDLDTLKLVGEATPVVEGIALSPNTAAGVALSASRAGPVAYRTASQSPRQLVWFDRSGRQIGVVGTPDPALSWVELSPDGRTAAVTRRINGNQDIWLVELARGVVERFTSDAAVDDGARWSPDGSRIAFHSARRGGGRYDLYVKSVTTGGAETVLVESPDNKNMNDWSDDGRFILYSSQTPETRRDIWAMPLDGDRTPFVVVQTAFEELNGRFSSDNRWIVYESFETGRGEIYVRPFPGPGRSVRISIDGGRQPRWRGDAREIFYLAPDNRVMAVPVVPQPAGPGLEPGTPIPLFPFRVGSDYAASPDGQRFLLNMPLDDDPTPPITVLLNWAGARK